MSTGILLTVGLSRVVVWLAAEKMMAWCCARAGLVKKSGRAHMLAQFLSGKKTKSVENYGRRGDHDSAGRPCLGEATLSRRGDHDSAGRPCLGEATLFRRI
jgi:hypothetical protein